MKRRTTVIRLVLSSLAFAGGTVGTVAVASTPTSAAESVQAKGGKGFGELIGKLIGGGAKEGDIYNRHHGGDDGSTPSVQDREPQSTTANLENAPLDQLPAAVEGMNSDGE